MVESSFNNICLAVYEQHVVYALPCKAFLQFTIKVSILSWGSRIFSQFHEKLLI